MGGVPVRLQAMNLHDKIIVITGGGGLLGQHWKDAVYQAGGRPFSLDLHAGHFDSIPCDVTVEQDVREVTQYIEDVHGPIYGLVNNASRNPKMTASGLPATGRVEDTSGHQFIADLLPGLQGAYICSRIIGEKMANRRTGVIVNIASELGLVAPHQVLYGDQRKPASYVAEKHALIGLTRYFATYWEGIRCNALALGGVQTPQIPEQFIKARSALIPLARMATPEEYQSALVFTLTSTYLNGSVISVDGGMTAW